MRTFHLKEMCWCFHRRGMSANARGDGTYSVSHDDVGQTKDKREDKYFRIR